MSRIMDAMGYKMDKRTCYGNMLKEVDKLVSMVSEMENDLNYLTSKMVTDWDELSEREREKLRIERRLLEHFLSLI